MCKEGDEDGVNVADAGSDARCLHPVISGSSVLQMCELFQQKSWIDNKRW